MKLSHFAAGIALLALSPLSAASVSSTFEEIALAADSHYYPLSSTSFDSGAAGFNHELTDWGGGFTSWSGWTVSNEHDTATAGYQNQFSVYAGGGQGDGGNFAVAYQGQPVASLAAPALVEGAWFANTTYAALSMLQGDSFAKKFGGATGDDPDWLRLTIVGREAGGLQTGAVDFYLADYRFADNASDYIVQDWTWVDLAALNTLGAPTQLEFVLASSDSGAFGMNTPAYFAMDNLAVSPVPWPAAAWLYATGLATLGLWRRRRA
jgi:hypothetical protein